MTTATVDHTKPVIRSVTLKLNSQVAQFLLELTGAASGLGKARIANDSIYDALRTAGFKCAGPDCSGDPTWLSTAPAYNNRAEIEVSWRPE